MRKILYSALFLGAVAIFAAYPTDTEKDAAPSARKAEEGLKELAQAREAFGREALRDWRKIVRFILVIGGAAGLGAVIGYHPSSGRGTTRDDIEQPKTIIIYTVVGALVAIVVAPIPAMAFAIFGIGGLMRFRTILGAAKETGRVIMATVIGLMCGLEFWMAAVVGTALAWVLIYLLEARLSMKLMVREVESKTISQTADAYAKALKELKCGCYVLRKNPAKGQVSFQLQVPRAVDREAIEAKLSEAVPKELQGTVDWPED